MAVSFAALGAVVRGGSGGGGDELTIDRLFAFSELGLDGHHVRSVAGGDSRRRVAAQSINRAIGADAPHHRDLRAHPPTDLVALTCRARCAMCEAEILLWRCLRRSEFFHGRFLAGFHQRFGSKF